MNGPYTGKTIFNVLLGEWTNDVHFKSYIAHKPRKSTYEEEGRLAFRIGKFIIDLRDGNPRSLKSKPQP